MSTEPSHPEGDELAPGEVLRLYGMSPHSAKNLIAKIKADAVRGFAHEVQRGLDREHPRLDQEELSTRITLIAEADAYAQRIEEEA